LACTGAGGGRRCTDRAVCAARKDQFEGHGADAFLGKELLDPPGKPLAHQFKDETVRGREGQAAVFRSAAIHRQRPDPGVELLSREFAFEAAQTGVPEVLH
jgi:hypothetical protein